MTAPALELRDIRKQFGPTEIIRGVSLAIATRERHAVIGPNGAGKSTLFDSSTAGCWPWSATAFDRAEGRRRSRRCDPG